MCNTNGKFVKHIRESVATSAEEDNWDYDKIQLIKSINATSGEDKRNFFTVTLLVNEQPIKFIIDSGSPISLIPKEKFKQTTKLTKIKNKYKDVNNNFIEFEGETIATVKSNGKQFELPLLITTKKTNPLLGLDWMERLGIRLENLNDTITINNIEMEDIKQRTGKIQSEFTKLFYTNKEVKNLEVKVNLKEGAKIIQQKG